MRKILESKSEKVNHLTGEVEETSVTRVFTKTETQEKFFKLFAKETAMLFSLENASDFSLLFGIIYYCSSPSNLFYFNSHTKLILSEKLNIHRNTISLSFKRLLEKKVILEPKEESKIKEYMLNPNIFGSGGFKNIEELRQVAVLHYNFRDFSVKKEIGSTRIFEGGKDLLTNPRDYQIKNIEESNNGISRVKEIEIQKITNKEYDDVIRIDAPGANQLPFFKEDHNEKESTIEADYVETSIDNENKTQNDYESMDKIKLLELENKKLELAQKDKEIELEKMKVEAKMKELELRDKEATLELKKIEIQEALIKQGRLDEAMKL